MGLLSELRLRSRTIRCFAELVLLLRPGRLLPVRDPMHYRLAGGPSELTRSAPAAMSVLNDARCGSRGPQCGGEDLQSLHQFRSAARCTEADSNRLRGVFRNTERLGSNDSKPLSLNMRRKFLPPPTARQV